MRRVYAGCYEHGGRLIVQTSWEGPRGGTIWRWELADRDEWGGIVIEGLGTFRTLRAAREHLDAESEQ